MSAKNPTRVRISDRTFEMKETCECALQFGENLQDSVELAKRCKILEIFRCRKKPKL